jgi:hypothetical protein
MPPGRGRPSVAGEPRGGGSASPHGILSPLQAGELTGAIIRGAMLRAEHAVCPSADQRCSDLLDDAETVLGSRTMPRRHPSWLRFGWVVADSRRQT